MKNGLNKILAILMLYSAVSLFSNAENDAMKHDTIDYIENTQFVFSYPSLSREVCGGEGECIYKSITCKDDGVFLVFGWLHNTINSFDFQLINKAEFRDKYSTTKCGSYHNQDSIIQVYNQDTLTRYYREDIYKSGIDVYYFNAKEQDTIKYNKILDSVKSQIYSIEDSLAKSKLKQDNCYEKKFSSGNKSVFDKQFRSPIWPPPSFIHYSGDSASYHLFAQRISFLADNNYPKDKYVFDDGMRHIIISFVNDKVMKVENIDPNRSGQSGFVETYTYHFKDVSTIKVDSLIATTRESEKKKKNDYIHPFEYRTKKESKYSLFPSLENNVIRFSNLFDKLQIIDFLCVVE